MENKIDQKRERRMARIYAARQRRNKIFLTLSVLAAGFGIMWLSLILSTLFYEGFGGLSPKVFAEMTPPPGEDGGLANAIVGSLIMSGMAVAAGTPIGILAGTYLAEYGRFTRLAQVIRFVNDILLSAPSIVIGLFIYQLMVIQMHHFSAWAGAAALMAIVIPVVVRTTENMLLLVPHGLREAAAALGAPQSKVIRAVTWKAAQAGMVTGVLLAVARISGETAPLLFTALNNQFWSTDFNAPMASLPAVIFQFAMSPYEDWHKLAWAGALLITLAVLTPSIIARVLESRRKTA
jgi:phosphate transport system permease protein